MQQLSVSELILRLKGTSSMFIRKRKYPTVRASSWIIFQVAIFLVSSCTRAPISIIRQYIE
ncbi:transposase [Succinatimonas hippei]|uniref:transposase n=1 Tax=Succinatimonas hippei TaxID=626938 RepID=UPI003D175B85